jgi:hypothetical protein
MREARRRASRAGLRAIAVGQEALERPPGKVASPIDAARLVKLGAELVGLADGSDWVSLSGKQVQLLIPRLQVRVLRGPLPTF